MVLVSVSAGLLLLFVGAFVSLKGLKFARFILPFIVGLLGFIMVHHILQDLGANNLLSYGLGAVAGLMFAAGSYFFYKVAIILQFATLGYLLTFSLFGLVGWYSGVVPTLVAVVMAMGFAALAMLTNVWNYLILVGTAFGGATIGIQGLLIMFIGYEKMQYILDNEMADLKLENWASMLLLVIYGGWAIYGMMHQIREMGGVEGIRDFELSFFRMDSLPVTSNNRS